MYNSENAHEMVECPYNQSHRMLRKRLQSHLMKCRLSYPDVELQKCPFNQTHLIPEPEFVHHVTNCSDRKLITQYKYDAPAPEPEHERVKHEPIECEENWDDTEVEDYDPKKYVEKARVLRRIDGGLPAERKAFVKMERKRLGDYDSDDEKEEKAKIPKTDLDSPDSSDEEADNIYTKQGTEAPPPPSNITWFEDTIGRFRRRGENFKEHQVSRRPKQRYRQGESSDSRGYIEQEGVSARNSQRDNMVNRTVHNLDEDPCYSRRESSAPVNEGYDSARDAENTTGRGAYRGRTYNGSSRGKFSCAFYQL